MPEGEQPAEERSMWGDFVKGISALGEVPAAVKKAASELPGAVKKASRELPGGMRQAAKELPKGVKQFVKEGYVDPLKEDLATLGDGKFTKEDVFVVGGLILDAVSLGRSRVIKNLHKSVDKAKRNLVKNSDKIEVGNKGTGNTYTPVEYKGTTKVEGQTRDISRRVYQRSDIDWNQVDPETGLTNLELMKKGRPPYWKDGTKVELHHTIQLEPGPMVELPASLHDEYSKILHGLVENGGSFRNNPALEKQYNNFRSKYWRWRARQLEGKE
ncbi:HNH/ENDO VII family nuclease [Brevibacillus gelatini]|uniref:HNH/ENDO VII family nuclease n=1 Tax=Brevibacillus gelatini TaxID=1655277 RepID=UPI00319D9AC5